MSRSHPWAPEPGIRMAREIAEQPSVLRGLVDRWDRELGRLRVWGARTLRGIALVARGSSDHAAVYGRYLLEAAAGVPVSLVAPSLHTLYRARVRYEDHLLVAVSQSGRTPEIVTVVERLRAAGARSIALTNDPRSPLASAVDTVVNLDAGEELAVPATKTVTAEMAAFALVAEALGSVPWTRGDLEALPESVGRVVADPSPAEAVAAALEGDRHLIAVGRGYLFGSALEAALKLKEAALLDADGHSAADFRHGPIAAARREVPVLAFLVRGPAQTDVLDLVRELGNRGVRVFTVSDDAAADLLLPAGPEALAPVAAVVRAQQLAHAVALRRGLDPDRPEGLSKVTATR